MQLSAQEPILKISANEFIQCCLTDSCRTRILRAVNPCKNFLEGTLSPLIKEKEHAWLKKCWDISNKISSLNIVASPPTRFTESEVRFGFQSDIKHLKKHLLISSNRSDSPAVSKWCKAWSSQGLACNQVQWPCKSEPDSQEADRTREIPSYSWREVTLHK